MFYFERKTSISDSMKLLPSKNDAHWTISVRVPPIGWRRHLLHLKKVWQPFRNLGGLFHFAVLERGAGSSIPRTVRQAKPARETGIHLWKVSSGFFQEHPPRRAQRELSNFCRVFPRNEHFPHKTTTKSKSLTRKVVAEGKNDVETEQGRTFGSRHMRRRFVFWGGERRFCERLSPQGGLLRLPEVDLRVTEWHIITSGRAGAGPRYRHPKEQRGRWLQSPGGWAEASQDLHRGVAAGGAVRDLQRRRQEERGQLGQLHGGVRVRRLPGEEQLRLQLPPGATGEANQEAPDELPGPERWCLRHVVLKPGRHDRNQGRL